VEFAVDLALRFSCHVEPVEPGDDGVRASQTTKTIWMEPITDDASLAMLAHEIGHCEDPVAERPSLPMGRHSLVAMHGEIAAWAFAMRVLGRRWNHAMHTTLVRCLWAYREHGPFIQSQDEREAMDLLVDASAEQARGRVRLLVPNGSRR
jgi:hypothetical protein